MHCHRWENVAVHAGYYAQVDNFVRVMTLFGYVVTFVLKPAHVCAQVVVLFAS